MSMYFKEPFDKEKIEKQHEELLNIFKEDLSNLSDKTIKKHIQNVDFFINEYLLNRNNANYEEVNNEEKNTQVNKLNSEEEIKKAYEESIGLFDEKKYDESIEKLQSAYNSDVDTYYRKHVLFLLASCYYEKNQINEAIQYYEEYIGKYDETYIEEIYYKLALAYENIDLNKSKEYANYIKNKFSNSIYNNSKISQIIYK